MNGLGGHLVGFKQHLRAAVAPGEAAYLVSARGVTALRGRPIEKLAPLLDGSRTFGAIVREAAPELRADEVGALLGRLAEAEVLAIRDVDCDTTVAPDVAYWEMAGLDGAAAVRAVARTPVELVVVGRVDDDPLRAALSGSGLRLAEDGPDADPAGLCVVLCEDYLDPALAAVDRQRRADGRPWLLARISGPEPWIGPFFQAGADACWSCLAYRLAELRRPEQRVREILAGEHRLPEASLGAALAVASQLVVLEAAKWLAGVREPNQHAVYTLDTITLSGRHHPAVRRPQCPDCGDPALVARQARRPVRLQPRPKAGDGHRSSSDEEVFDRYRHLVDPVVGLVKKIIEEEQAGGLYRSIAPGYALIRGDTPDAPQSLVPMYSGGKGTNALAAWLGSLGEAVERHSACRQGDEYATRARYRDLGARAVHPDAVQLYDERQFADRDRWNRRYGAAHWICEPFDEDRVREWTPVWSLTAQCPRLVPTALLYFHHGGPEACSQVCADSNGNAAGASLEDAIMRGFLELVERDAVALWWYNRAPRPPVDLDAFADGWVDRTRRAAREAGRQVWALDLTTDLGIPVFAAFSAAVGGAEPRPRFGFGAHLDARAALHGAFAELGQAAAPTRLGLEPHLVPAPAPARGPDAYPYTPRSDLRDEVFDAVALLRRHGLELLVLDQTRPDVGMPVVKVLVPGLRPMRARFGAGRLFDVPVAQGWLAEPTAYDRLNPVPLPL